MIFSHLPTYRHSRLRGNLLNLFGIPFNNTYILKNKIDIKNGGIVYIITNKHRTVLYIGVTNDIKRRMYEHKKMMNKGFASKYGCTDLLYYEAFWDIADSIQRETILKKWNREWKLNLIKKENPEMVDLSANWFNETGELIS